VCAFVKPTIVVRSEAARSAESDLERGVAVAAMTFPLLDSMLEPHGSYGRTAYATYSEK
jgi:hypothetical protein